MNSFMSKPHFSKVPNQGQNRGDNQISPLFRERERKSSCSLLGQAIFTPFVWPIETMKDVINAVCADLQRRAKLGEKKYGERLAPFNGRRGLQDLYEELLDAANYCKQLLMEEEMELKIKRIRSRVKKPKRVDDEFPAV